MGKDRGRRRARRRGHGRRAIALASLENSIEHEKTERFTVSKTVRKLVASSGSGDVKITGADTDKVTFSRTMHWEFDDPDATHTVSGTILRLDDECGDTENLFDCDTDYVIEVPRNLPVEIDTGWGDVEATGLAGPVLVTSDGGDVSATKLKSSLVQATAELGDLQLGFDVPPTIVNAESDTAHIELDLPREHYAINVESDSGDAVVNGIVADDDADRALELESDTGDITVTGR